MGGTPKHDSPRLTRAEAEAFLDAWAAEQPAPFPWRTFREYV